MFTATTAAVNSIRGTVICFKGATLDFPGMSAHCARPSLFFSLKDSMIQSHIYSHLHLQNDEVGVLQHPRIPQVSNIFLQ